jgi:hypothetical protein
MVRGRLQSNGLQTLQRELHFGVIGILLGCEEREREKLPRVFEKQQCLPHHLCSKLNVHVQHLTPLKATKAAAAGAPPPHGEERVQPGGACCSVSVCPVNPNLPINNYCSTPDFFPECTEWKQRRQSELPANVSFLALFLSQCVSTICLSWFVCGKLLN